MPRLKKIDFQSNQTKCAIECDVHVFADVRYFVSAIIHTIYCLNLILDNSSFKRK